MTWVELHGNRGIEGQTLVLTCFYRSRYAVCLGIAVFQSEKKKVYVENGVKISFHTFPEERKVIF